MRYILNNCLSIVQTRAYKSDCHFVQKKTKRIFSNMDLVVIHSLLSNKQLHKHKLKLNNELVSLLNSPVDGIIVASCKDEIGLPCMRISSL